MLKINNILNEMVNELSFELFEDEDRFTINGFLGKTNIGYIVVELIQYGYHEFEDVLTDDEYDELFPEDSFGKIEHLIVFDEFKNKKFGQQLVNQALKFIKDRGYKVAYLNASPMGFTGLSLPKLVDFYKTFGFKVIPQTDKWKENKEMILRF